MTGNALWGGRFAGGPDDVFRALNDSLPVDWRMVQHDIRGSIAWARALKGVGVYDNAELARVVAALEAIAGSAPADPPIETGAEDVHTWVEQRLTETVGELGKRLHTGRSRNDQVATDLRLWMRDAVATLDERTTGAMRSLVEQAIHHAGTPFPAYTHLQSAQPVTFGHWCLAYVEMLDRDRARLRDAAGRFDQCPLGSAALAGTTYAVDRDAIADELGFAAPTRNSLDAIASRDHVIELLGVLAMLGVHLSRLAEDLSVYTSVEFGLVELDDGVTSGSSLMPQKKNPDSLELIRGMAGQLIGAQTAMLTTVKGLPMSYNKDLQFDKPVLFGAVDNAGAMLALAARTVEGLTVRVERAGELAAAGHANATDVADLLVAAGVPFREAHERVGAVVRAAIEAGSTIDGLPDERLRELLPEIDPAAVRALTVEAMLDARDVFGGTAPGRVARAAQDAVERLSGPE
ncbi:MAG: argininosuccinate lyase [Planctomycetota bacterium]